MDRAMSNQITQYATGRRPAEETLADRFRDFGATVPETAQDIVPANEEEASGFDRLRLHGVIRGAGGGFYLDEDALQELNQRRRGWFYGTAGLLGLAAGLVGWRLATRRD